MTTFCKNIGREYLVKILSEVLESIASKNYEMEIFADKVSDRGQIAQNYRNIELSFQLLFDSVISTTYLIPWQIRVILYHIHQIARKKFPQLDVIWVPGSFFFLRFLCPAIISGGIVIAPSSNFQRGLLFLIKILQNLANNVTFGAKEKEMYPFNSLMEKNKPRLIQFLEEISLPVMGLNQKPRPISDESFNNLQQEIISILDKLEPILYTSF